MSFRNRLEHLVAAGLVAPQTQVQHTRTYSLNLNQPVVHLRPGHQHRNSGLGGPVVRTGSVADLLETSRTERFRLCDCVTSTYSSLQVPLTAAQSETLDWLAGLDNFSTARDVLEQVAVLRQWLARPPHTPVPAEMAATVEATYGRVRGQHQVHVTSDIFEDVVTDQLSRGAIRWPGDLAGYNEWFRRVLAPLQRPASIPQADRAGLPAADAAAGLRQPLVWVRLKETSTGSGSPWPFVVFDGSDRDYVRIPAAALFVVNTHELVPLVADAGYTAIEVRAVVEMTGGPHPELPSLLTALRACAA